MQWGTNGPPWTRPNQPTTTPPKHGLKKLALGDSCANLVALNLNYGRNWW
jgi:hypothetical protein